MHAKDGVDFMTIHCGINRATADRFKQNLRHTNIVSRGGSIIFAWMELTGNENPFYERYDELLDICEEYDVTISLEMPAVREVLKMPETFRRFPNWLHLVN